MNLGDTFKVRKPPNSLFLDTMEVLNKESWSLLCSSYQWGAKLSSCYCHHITLHSLLQSDITDNNNITTKTITTKIIDTNTDTINTDTNDSRKLNSSNVFV